MSEVVSRPGPVIQLPNVRPIGLRWRYVPAPREGVPADVWTDRMLILGAVGTGKSTLAEQIILDALRRYRELRVLILDSKPRFRAEFETNGLSAQWTRYRRWAHGSSPLPGSIALPMDDPAAALGDVWRFGGQVAVAQAPEGAETPVLEQMLDVVTRFHDMARADRPQLLYIDEVMDFYYLNGSPIGKNNAIIQAVRAGRELGLGVVAATQRPRGIPAQLLQEANAMALFWLRNVEDLDRLADFSLPDAEARMPRKNDKTFYYYDHERPARAGRYHLDLKAA